MRMIMNDDILGRLVAYEKYVKQCFAQAARARRRGRNTSTIQEYDKSKELKNYVSALVDLAFERYGMQSGLTKTASAMQDLALNKDLDSLVAQLCWPSAEQYLSPPKRQFALVS